MELGLQKHIKLFFQVLIEHSQLHIHSIFVFKRDNFHWKSLFRGLITGIGGENSLINGRLYKCFW